MKKIQVALLGLGTVGGGVAAILKSNGASLVRRLGAELVLKTVLVRDLNKARAEDGDFALTTDPAAILADPDIDIVVEVMGGMEPARTYILAALRAGKNVVTANKDLLAVAGEEIFRVAAENGKDVGLEGSVAGGIPIIAAIRQSLVANEISAVTGIINGTTNYILTAMTEEGRDFEDVLQEAQAKGYAESDPTADVEGLDAARKLAILSTLAFHSRVEVGDIYTEGITKISAQDIVYAKELNAVIKLLAIGKKTESGVEVRVQPTLIPEHHPLATVRGVYNAVYVTSDALGESMYYGQGAGGLPTGSAVVADIINIARSILAGTETGLGLGCYLELPLLPSGEYVNSFYIRLKVKDEPRVFASLALFFAEADISFASIIQKPRFNGNAEIVLVTHPCRRAQLSQALTSLKAYSKLEKIYNVICMENF